MTTYHLTRTSLLLIYSRYGHCTMSKWLPRRLDETYLAILPIRSKVFGRRRLPIVFNKMSMSIPDGIEGHPRG
jgi:hypothetical protein